MLNVLRSSSVVANEHKALFRHKLCCVMLAVKVKKCSSWESEFIQLGEFLYFFQATRNKTTR